MTTSGHLGEVGDRVELISHQDEDTRIARNHRLH